MSTFWEKYNKPFLDRAIERGDDILLATIPMDISDLTIETTGELKGMYAHELKYLVEKKYRPVNVGLTKWQVIISWFK